MVYMKTEQLYDLEHTIAKELLLQCEYPWLALPRIKETVLALIEKLPPDEYDAPAPDIRIAKSAKVSKNATICGPAIIGAHNEI